MPAARPLFVDAAEGERIWFAQNTMTIKATAAATGGDLSLVEVLVAPRSGPPLHGDHEAFYVLDGGLDVVCGDERFHGEAGSFAFLPRGIAHAFRATGERPARLLSIGVPAGIEDFFRDGGRPAEHPGLPPHTALDVAELKRVALRHGNEIVGPQLS